MLFSIGWAYMVYGVLYRVLLGEVICHALSINHIRSSTRHYLGIRCAGNVAVGQVFSWAQSAGWATTAFFSLRGRNFGRQSTTMPRSMGSLQCFIVHNGFDLVNVNLLPTRLLLCMRDLGPPCLANFLLSSAAMLLQVHQGQQSALGLGVFPVQSGHPS